VEINQKGLQMKGTTLVRQVAEVKYSGWCVHEDIELAQTDWLKQYFRFSRMTTVSDLEFLLAESKDATFTEQTAIALRLADLKPSGDWFKRACHLAQTATIDQLESALNLIQDQDEFIAVLLALVHYELFDGFELGRFVASVEIIKVSGKAHRRYVNP
jgi:hypothetical protein